MVTESWRSCDALFISLLSLRPHCALLQTTIPKTQAVKKCFFFFFISFFGFAAILQRYQTVTLLADFYNPSTTSGDCRCTVLKKKKKSNKKTNKVILFSFILLQLQQYNASHAHGIAYTEIGLELEPLEHLFTCAPWCIMLPLEK